MSSYGFLNGEKDSNLLLLLHAKTEKISPFSRGSTHIRWSSFLSHLYSTTNLSYCLLLAFDTYYSFLFSTGGSFYNLSFLFSSSKYPTWNTDCCFCDRCSSFALFWLFQFLLRRNYSRCDAPFRVRLKTLEACLSKTLLVQLVHEQILPNNCYSLC